VEAAELAEGQAGSEAAEAMKTEAVEVAQEAGAELITSTHGIAPASSTGTGVPSTAPDLNPDPAPSGAPPVAYSTHSRGPIAFDSQEGGIPNCIRLTRGGLCISASTACSVAHPPAAQHRPSSSQQHPQQSAEPARSTPEAGRHLGGPSQSQAAQVPQPSTAGWLSGLSGSVLAETRQRHLLVLPPQQHIPQHHFAEQRYSTHVVAAPPIHRAATPAPEGYGYPGYAPPLARQVGYLPLLGHGGMHGARLPTPSHAWNESQPAAGYPPLALGGYTPPGQAPPATSPGYPAFAPPIGCVGFAPAPTAPMC